MLYSPSIAASSSDNLARLVAERLQIPISSNSAQHGERYSIPTVVDQSGIVVPAGWDSRGKILAVRDGFAADIISERWDADVHVPDLESSTELTPIVKNKSNESTTSEISETEAEIYEDIVSEPEIKVDDTKTPAPSAIVMYENAISTLHPDSDQEDETQSNSQYNLRNNRDAPQVKTDFQEFLSGQFDLLEERIKEEESARGGASPFRRSNRQYMTSSGNASGSIPGVPKATDINVGGIQIEGVEEVLRRLKIQEVAASNHHGAPSARSDITPGSSPYRTSSGVNGHNDHGSFMHSTSYVPHLSPHQFSASGGPSVLSSKRMGSPQQSSRDKSISNIRGSSPTTRSISVGGGVNHLGGGFNTTPTRLATSSIATGQGRTDDASNKTPTSSSKSQNEVLANFFQSLLDRNSSPGGGNSGGH